jgi:predicted RND superfamily exporter protein
MLFERLARLLQRRRWLSTLILVAVSGVVLSFAARARTDFTVQELFSTGDPELAFLERFREHYGADDDLVLIVVEAQDALGAKALAHVAALTAAMKADKTFREVQSATTISDLGAPGAGAIDTRPVYHDIPKDAAELRKRRARVMGSPLLGGRVVSTDGTLTTIGARLAKDMVRAKEMEQGVARVEALLKKHAAPEGIKRHLVGVPVVRTNLVRMLRVDQARFIPLTTVITALLLFLLYRSVAGVAIPLATIGLSVNYTIGLMTMLDVPLDILSNVLPVLVMVYGIADAVHMLNRYHEERALEGRSREIASQLMLRHLGLACLVTSLTTAIGFGSLASSKLEILRRFGLFAALGVILAYVLSVFVVPLGIEWLGRGKLRRAPGADGTGVIDRGLARLAAFVLRWPKALLCGGVLVALGCAAAGTQAKVDNFLLGTMKADHPVAIATRLLEKRLQGVVSMQIAFEGKANTLKRPDVLAQMAALQRWLHKEDGVTGSLSAADFVAELHRAAVGTRKLPQNPRAIAQLLLMTEGQSGIERYVDFAYKRGRIEVMLRDIGARRYLPLVERTRAEIARSFAEIRGVKVRVTGTSLLAYRGIDTLIWNLMTSLLIAFALIAPVLMITFRSVRVGLLTLIPNILPLTAGVGFMVALDIKLDVTTVMIYSIAFGIAVDDTIHFVARYREEVEAGRPVPEAVRTTLRSAGRAMLITSVILMIGFGVVLVSNFPGTQRFGILGVVIIGAAITTDLLITPACMLIFRPWAPKDAGHTKDTGASSAAGGDVTGGDA